ncbi:MAG: glycosyltransferase family 4 protein [Deltaproteobacteria bacterium]|nr:glycosyltransferase family 4 protein [Deltaproteobacteria bacterium]
MFDNSSSARSGTEGIRVWLIQEAEILPFDEGARVMRTGNLARRLASRGANVTWFTGRFNHALKRRREEPVHDLVQDVPGVLIHLIDGPSYSRNFSVKRILYQHVVAAKFLILARRYPKPDVVLCSLPSPELCWAAARFCKRRSIPLILDIRDPWPDMFLDYFRGLGRAIIYPLVRYYARLVKSAAGCASAIVAVSTQMLDMGMSYAGRPRAKYDRVLFLGYPPTDRKPDPTDFPGQFSEKSPLELIFIGTFGHSYNIEPVIDLMRELEGKGDMRCRLTLVGAGDNDARWRARAIGLRSVRFTGWVGRAELESLVQNSHVGLTLYRGGLARFAMPNKLFEYCAHGLAILTNLPQDARSLAERGAGLFVNSDSELRAAVDRFVEDPTFVQACRTTARKIFESDFSSDIVSEDLASLVLAVAKSSANNHG